MVLEGKELMQRVGGLRKLKNDFGEVIGEEIVDKREFTSICKNLRVVGRCTPDVRYLLVAGLKERTLVAATGHGNDDVLTLRKANVGLSFGRREGCEISKDNSDIVLLDESFKSIQVTVMQGRAIYANVRKFLQLQLTMNLMAMLFVVLASLFTGDSPLTPVHLLWLNLLMDALGALALSTDPPSQAILVNQQPLRRGEQVLTPTIARNIILMALF